MQSGQPTLAQLMYKLEPGDFRTVLKLVPGVLTLRPVANARGYEAEQSDPAAAKGEVAER